MSFHDVESRGRPSEFEVKLGDTATQGAHSKASQCGLGWAERASLIVECGSPGNPKGVHQSGSGAAEATGTPQERGDAFRSGGGKCWRGGAGVRGGKGEGETGKEETIANGVGCVGGGGVKEWNVSQVARPHPPLSEPGRQPSVSGSQQGGLTCDSVTFRLAKPPNTPTLHLTHFP